MPSKNKPIRLFFPEKISFLVRAAAAARGQTPGQYLADLVSAVEHDDREALRQMGTMLWLFDDEWKEKGGEDHDH